jgi:hypothetical protein
MKGWMDRREDRLMLGQIDRYGLRDSAFAFFTILGISTLPRVRKLFVWADGWMIWIDCG